MNTILQKRIEEAAFQESSMYDTIQEKNAAFNATIKAATFALQNQWISVEEALPEIVDGYRSALVIVRSKYNSYDVAKWDDYYKDWITPDYAVANVTHWMPIPSLKGGE